MPYQGNEDATGERVRRYLRENYTDADGGPVSDARLTELLTEHDEIVTRGVERLSHACYVGDQVADVAGLGWAGDDAQQ